MHKVPRQTRDKPRHTLKALNPTSNAIGIPKPTRSKYQSLKAQGVISSVRAPFSQDLGPTSAACDKRRLLRGVHEQGS